jgi:hypothetical protein
VEKFVGCKDFSKEFVVRNAHGTNFSDANPTSGDLYVATMPDGNIHD